MSGIRSKIWKAFLSRTAGWVMWVYSLAIFGLTIYLHWWMDAFISAVGLCLLTYGLSLEAENRTWLNGFLGDKEP